MAIAFARPLLFRGRVPKRALLQQIKARAPAPRTQAATINRPFRPFPTGFLPVGLREPFAAQRAACVAKGGRWVEAGRSSRCEMPTAAAPFVAPVVEPVAVGAVPFLSSAERAAFRVTGETCATCGAAAPAAPVSAAVPVVAAPVPTEEVSGPTVRFAATGAEVPTDTGAPAPVQGPRKAGVLIGLGLVVTVAAVLFNLTQR